jgi:hypothetical protein
MSCRIKSSLGGGGGVFFLAHTTQRREGKKLQAQRFKILKFKAKNMFFPSNWKEKARRKLCGPNLHTLAKETKFITNLFREFYSQNLIYKQKTLWGKILSKHKNYDNSNRFGKKNAAYIN